MGDVCTACTALLLQSTSNLVIGGPSNIHLSGERTTKYNKGQVGGVVSEEVTMGAKEHVSCSWYCCKADTVSKDVPGRMFSVLLTVMCLLLFGC